MNRCTSHDLKNDCVLTHFYCEWVRKSTEKVEITAPPREDFFNSILNCSQAFSTSMYRTWLEGHGWETGRPSGRVHAGTQSRKVPVGMKVSSGRREIEIGELSSRRGRGRLEGQFSRPWYLCVKTGFSSSEMKVEGGGRALGRKVMWSDGWLQDHTVCCAGKRLQQVRVDTGDLPGGPLCNSAKKWLMAAPMR